MNYETPLDYDDLLNDVAKQMASSQLSRRHSRSSTGRVSMTPKRHSAGVVKPVSAHNSPYGIGRRRTTSAVRQYASLDDHYNYMFGAGDLHGNAPTTTPPSHQINRPVSWHPRSSNTRSKRFSSTTDMSDHPVPPLTTFAQEDHTPAGSLTPAGLEYTSHDHMHEPMPVMDPHFHNALLWEQYMASTNWNVGGSGSAQRFSNGDALLFPASDALAWSSHDAYSAHSMLLSSPPVEMDGFLPIQHPATAADAKSLRSPLPSEKSKTDLVGMGLYDNPSPAADGWTTAAPSGPSSMLLAGGSPAEGKGLKLEDSFEPPPDLGQDDDDDEVEEVLVELPRPEDHALLQQNHATNMAGQSFFFDDDMTHAPPQPQPPVDLGMWYAAPEMKAMMASNMTVAQGWF